MGTGALACPAERSSAAIVWRALLASTGAS